jgi:hypothetical protein
LAVDTIQQEKTSNIRRLIENSFLRDGLDDSKLSEFRQYLTDNDPKCIMDVVESTRVFIRSGAGMPTPRTSAFLCYVEGKEQGYGK